MPKLPDSLPTLVAALYDKARATKKSLVAVDLEITDLTGKLQGANTRDAGLVISDRADRAAASAGLEDYFTSLRQQVEGYVDAPDDPAPDQAAIDAARAEADKAAADKAAADQAAADAAAAAQAASGVDPNLVG